MFVRLAGVSGEAARAGGCYLWPRHSFQAQWSQGSGVNVLVLMTPYRHTEKLRAEQLESSHGGS